MIKYASYNMLILHNPNGNNHKAYKKSLTIFEIYLILCEYPNLHRKVCRRLFILIKCTLITKLQIAFIKVFIEYYDTDVNLFTAY